MSDDLSPSAMAQQLAVMREQIERLSTRLDEVGALALDIRGLVGPFGVPMPHDRMLVQTIHGLKYLIDSHDLVMAPQLIVYRQWEADLSALFRRLLTPDSVVVDVGANFGYFTCLAAATIGLSGGGRVFAVEPNPHLVELLRANVIINWSMCPIEILPFAAGPAHGEVRLSIPRDRAANASLTRLEGTNITTIATTLRPIDDIVPAGTAVHLMKVDVEGHEAGVFQGARRVIADSPDIHIVLEWSQPQMEEAGSTALGMIALFENLGLTAFAVPSDGAVENAVPLSPATLLETPYTNILLRPR